MSYHVPRVKSQMLGWLLHLAGLLPLLVAAPGVYWYVLKPLREQTTARENARRELDDQLARAHVVRSRHHKLQRELADLEKRAEAVLQRIPPQAREADFLEQMTTAAAEEGLVIRDYRRGAISDLETHRQLEIRVLADGDYGSLCRFLARLGSLPRISTVENMTITSGFTSAPYPLDLTLMLYFGLRDLRPEQEEVSNG